jgi:ribosomal-protein-serine acetyltransferase
MFSYPVNEEVELRLPEERHAEAFYQMVVDNMSHLHPWLPWARERYRFEETQAFIRRNLRDLADGKGWAMGIWYRGQPAGFIAYNSIDWTNRTAEIGYWLAADAQGKGIMTSACRAMIDYAFGELRLNRVEIRCAVENHRSRAIPERLGFTKEGIHRQAEWLHDRHVDLVAYAMLAEEWPSGDDLWEGTEPPSG